MDLNAPVVAPVGNRTQWHVGGPPPANGAEVRAPSGVVRYEPADMTITVGAGTTWRELAATVGADGQDVPLDPASADATVGGILACGLSGRRRLGCGPVRDTVLEVQFVTGDGVLVKGGGPTVKNVTGYDLPRLFVGSFGTLGVLMQATLRCRPAPPVAQWFTGADARAAFRPWARLWDGTREHVLLAGTSRDVDEEARRLALDTAAEPPRPAGAHRGRISVAPARVRAVAAALGSDVSWQAELGVGTVHVATDSATALQHARATAHAHDGWMLREAGGDPNDDGYGRPLPNVALMRRIKDAFDPDGRMNPGRLPL